MKTSIMAAALARQTADTKGRATMNHITAFYRHCRHSNSVFVEAFTSGFDYGCSRGFAAGKYVKNATPERIRLHLADVIENVRQWRANPVHTMRQRTYELAETKVIDFALLDAMANGRPQDYESMSTDDCVYWIDVLNGMPNKE